MTVPGRTRHEGKKFEMLTDLELPQTLNRAVLQKCWFFACAFGMTARRPSERRRIVDVNLTDCKATNNTWLGPVLVEDVEVRNLRTGGLCIAWGAAFKRVRISGRCGKLMLTLPRDSEQEFIEDNRAFYSRVDWALDISEGEFEELELRGVPADLVRRDPETQVVVRRLQVERLEKVWRGLNLDGTPWVSTLEQLLKCGLEDQVLVAARRRKDFAVWLAGLRRLQDAGVADRD